jgi:hypothetical protein
VAWGLAEPGLDRSRTRGTDPVARLRAICLALPEANEKISHGEPAWFAGKGKVFAMLDDHHHGAPRCGPRQPRRGWTISYGCWPAPRSRLRLVRR